MRLQVIYTHRFHCCIFSAIVLQFPFYMFLCDSLSCNISIFPQASGIVQLRHVRTELHVLMMLLVAAANANLDSRAATARQVVTLVFVRKSAMSNFTANSDALIVCWMHFNLQFTNNCYDADKGTEKFNKAVKITLNKQKLQKAGIFSTQGFPRKHISWLLRSLRSTTRLQRRRHKICILN